MRQHCRIKTASAVGCAVSLFLAIAPSPVRSQDGEKTGSPAVDRLKFNFEVAKGELEKPIEEFKGKYAASLKALQEKVRKAGKLEQTLAVKNELAGFAEGKTKPAEDFDELERLQGIYAKESENLQRAFGRQFKPLLEEYQKSLIELKSELTKQNKLEEAIVAVEEEKRVQSLLKGLAASGSLGQPDDETREERGLLLRVGDETRLWKNEIASLPGQTPIYFTGTLKLPPESDSFRLRGERAYGSDRLIFFVSGKQLDFEIEVSSSGNNRYVVVEVPEGTESLPIKIGKDSVSNNWEWGPLQWSFNERTWRDVPLKNLSPE